MLSLEYVYHKLLSIILPPYLYNLNRKNSPFFPSVTNGFQQKRHDMTQLEIWKSDFRTQDWNVMNELRLFMNRPDF